MRVIGLIPARGGSKGIPRKNITFCGGKPLIAHTIEAALAADGLERVVLSTDDPEIASVGNEYGAEVPFLRPTEVANDKTPMVEVIRHFVDWLDCEGENFDGIMLLQPTSPLRMSIHIDEAIEVFGREKPKSLVSVVEVPHNFSPTSIMELRDSELYEHHKSSVYLRQNKPRYYARNGPAILIVSRQAIEENHCYAQPCAAYVMDYWSSVDVDDPDTLLTADLFIRSRNGEI